MTKEAQVLLVEDDIYARNWMELLLRRDWRTRVVGEVSNPVKLNSTIKDLKKHNERVDLVIIDTDIPYNPNWLPEVLRSLEINSPESRVLFTGVEPDLQIANLRTHANFAGYVLKDEICNSIAWAVSMASEPCIIVTPGVRNLFNKVNVLPPGSLILDGRKPIALERLNNLEKKRSQMAFIFSMERHEFADEAGISEDYSYIVVSSLFEKIGLNDMLEDTLEEGAVLDHYFSNYPVVMTHLKTTLEHLEETKSKKAKDKETLAFHLLTLPVIEEIL